MDVEGGNREEEGRDPFKSERKGRNQRGNPQSSRWKTAGEHLTYSSKLLEALRFVAGRSSKSSSPLRNRIVREAADRVLAAAARGRTKWSRAMLSNCYALRLRRRKRRNFSSRISLRSDRGGCSSGSMMVKKVPAMDRKVKVLARLVPGGRKLSFPSLLEEASDYISALEMQVCAMNALAKVLSSVGSSSAPSTSPSPLPEA